MLPTITCRICAAELSEMRERLTGVCGNAKCQLAWGSRLQAQRRAELQIQRKRRYEIAKLHQDTEALRLGIELCPAIQAAVVPANLRKIVNLPERRKRAFQNHLMEIISRAAALRASSADSPPGETALDSSSPPPDLANLLGRGCATCRGRCCNGGGDHAYLNVDTVLGYLRAHPKQRPRHVLEAYLSFLPNRAYEDSCVYHTKTGCALPREMRGKISADYFCEELREFERHYYQVGEQTVMFHAFEENQVVRSEPFPESAGNLCKNQATS
jgi:hypothetical protein